MKSIFILFAIFIFILTPSIGFGYKATFLPRLSVNEEYSDNIFLTENDNQKEDDFITSITPGFTAEVLGKNNGAKISYDASYTKYNDWDIFDGWRHSARLDGWSQMTKNTRLNLRDSFLYTEDPLRDENLAVERTEDPDNPVDTTVRKSRRVYYRNFANINLSHQFGEYHAFRVGYSHYLLENDDPSFEDKQYHNPTAGLTYWFGPQWGFDVNGNYTKYTYEISEDVELIAGSVGLLKRFGKQFIGYIRYSHLLVDYEGEESDDETYYPSIGFTYDVAKDISVILNAGYFHNDFKSREDSDAFNGSLRLIKEFEHGKLNLSAAGGFDYAFGGAENLGYNEFYEGAVSASHRLTKFISGRIYGSYRNSKYPDESDREDDRATFGAGLTWQALEWMNIGLEYRFKSLDSTVAANDYDENRVTATITVYPTVPFHTSRY